MAAGNLKISTATQRPIYTIRATGQHSVNPNNIFGEKTRFDNGKYLSVVRRNETGEF